MSTLQENLDAIKLDKDTNLKPENLKKGITCLGVTGTLESGASSDYNTKIGDNYTNGNLYWFITEISSLNIKDSVTDTSNMFSSFLYLTAIPEFNTSNVTNMYGMFMNCRKITNIPVMNTSKVTNMEKMFYSCTNLTELPQLDTSSVTNMNQMFYDCSSLTTIPLLDTSNATNMYNMFSNCTSLSDESLNNILVMCANAAKITSNKTLKSIGLTEEQAQICTTLSNYQAFVNAGWTTGY